MRRFLPLIGCLALALLAGLPGFGQGPQKRVALLIGNAAYETRPLPNCKNDVRGMEAALRELGFEVTPLVDGDLVKMREALVAFSRKLGPETLGFFYYTGHGVQTDGQNYLIPVGADIRTRAQLKSLALPLQEVLDELEGKGTTVVVLDACRDDPLPAAAKSGKKGLIPLEAPAGSLIAFAASPGQTADANVQGTVSLYTEELLSALRTPGLKIEDLFKRTRAGVLRRSDNRQRPREDSALVDDIILRPGNAPPEPELPLVVGTKAQVSVTSTPAGARIFLDGVDTGEVTPATLEVELGVLRSRKVEIGLTRTGSKPQVREVTLERGKRSALNVALEGSGVPPPAGGRGTLAAGGAQPGERLQVPLTGSALSLDVVWAPPGSFTMGDDAGVDDEKPARRVTLTRGFWLLRTEVTNALYGQFLAANPGHRKPAYWEDARFNAAQQPVVGVSWDDAQVFCAWLSRVSGGSCGLPTEAQWEYAARGPQSLQYPWGAAAPDRTRAVFGLDLDTGRPAPVGSCPAGASWCGALDLAGNVWEWCQDWCDGAYYRTGDRTDPTGPAAGQSRVFRGGSWDDDPLLLRGALRDGGTPVNRSDDLGFRVVWPAAQ